MLYKPKENTKRSWIIRIIKIKQGKKRSMMTASSNEKTLENGEIYKFAKSLPVNLQDVEVTDDFWKTRIDQSRTHGLPKLLTEYENRPIVTNFLPSREHRGASNQDEFLYKALEAAAYYMDDDRPEELKKQYIRIRGIVIAAQTPDGYINTRTLKTNIEPFSPESIMDFYFAGHLMQAGIAELRTTGDTALFNAAKKFVDLLIEAYTKGGKKFNSRRYPFTDHPNFEMAVVELYRVTGDRKYLDFCKRILDFGDYANKDAVEAHAVMEMLFNTGAVDYYLETGDPLIWQSAVNQWNDMLKKMYVTGGVGAEHRGKRFAKPHDLPNSRAYAETCASISSVFWNWRMFLATGDAKYTDLMEHLLYNGVLSGISLNGHEYFYVNPLEYQEYKPHPPSDRDPFIYSTYWVVRRRESWECSCCPPNVQRLLASFQQYIYSVKGDSVWVNLFVGSTLKHQLPNDAKLTLKQRTEYPWKGNVEIRVSLDRPAPFSLKLRIPNWSSNAGVKVNGKPVKLKQKGGYYLDITREWKDSDVVKADFPMPVRLVRSHPRNTANIGKVVICRGPLVFCLESVDHPQANIFDIRLPLDGTFGCIYKSDLLGGIVLIEGDGFLLDTSRWDEQPFQEYKKCDKSELKPIGIKAVPYYAWANREHGSMITAIPYVE